MCLAATGLRVGRSSYAGGSCSVGCAQVSSGADAGGTVLPGYAGWMQEAADSVSTDTAYHRLLDAAEKLVALKGEGAAASRAIISEAGQRYNSAITYHFGSRRALFDVVWDRRSACVDQYRLPMLQKLVEPSLQDLAEVYVRPMAAYLDERTPSYWARFNEESLRRYPLQLPAKLRSTLDDVTTGKGLRTLLDVFEQMQKLVCDGVEPMAGLRVTQAVRTVVTTFAAWERERDRGTTDMTARELGEYIIPGVVGMLQAPPR